MNRPKKLYHKKIYNQHNNEEKEEKSKKDVPVSHPHRQRTHNLTLNLRERRIKTEECHQLMSEVRKHTLHPRMDVLDVARTTQPHRITTPDARRLAFRENLLCQLLELEQQLRPLRLLLLQPARYPATQARRAQRLCHDLVTYHTHWHFLHLTDARAAVPADQEAELACWASRSATDGRTQHARILIAHGVLRKYFIHSDRCATMLSTKVDLYLKSLTKTSEHDHIVA